MVAAGLSEAAVSAFKLNFDALAGGESGMVRRGSEERNQKKEQRKKKRNFVDNRNAPPSFPLSSSRLLQRKIVADQSSLYLIAL